VYRRVSEDVPVEETCLMLAMHMANELLTPGPAAGLLALAAVVLAVAARFARKQFDPGKVALMGVLGAFVFAAQMVNFPILVGTSGHLGGGLLLAILLGPNAAALVMASILIIQCLIFQDGGLLALGANILNMGVIPCYLGYGLFRLVAGESKGPGRLYAGIFVAAVVSIPAGAALVPLEAWASGVVAVPLSKFLLAMIGLHLLVALVEAFITFAVIGYVRRIRPELVEAAAGNWPAEGRGLGIRAVAGSVLVVALLVAGVLSLLGSSFPDALESVTSAKEAPDKTMVRTNDNPTVAAVSAWQGRFAPLPDYRWTSLSGLLGTCATLLVVWGIGRSLRRRTFHDRTE
jgi:cobalt/nickel transport system permease protein